VGNDLGFSYQHAIEVTGDGDLVLYDNGNQRQPTAFSRGIEIGLTETATVPTAEINYQYVLPDSLYTGSNGDFDKLPNGNYMITAANPDDPGVNAHIIEVDPTDDSRVWQLRMGDDGTNSTFASDRIPGMYPQAFSVVKPDFVEFAGDPTLFLTTKVFTLGYTIHNEGVTDATYNWAIDDNEGMIGGTGEVFVPAGGSADLEIEGLAFNLYYPNVVEITVTPQLAPAKEQVVRLYLNTEAVPLLIDDANLPKSFALRQNYPNPFNPATIIAFDVPYAVQVKLTIYDILGREVITLHDGQLKAGRHAVTFSGRRADGQELAGGIYFARLVTPEYSKVRKMLLLK
jgi:hypothetical protein